MLSFYKFLKFFFRYVVPHRLRYSVARLFSRLVYAINAPRRKILIQNLTPLVGEAEAQKRAPVLFENFAMTAVDFFCARVNIARGMLEKNTAIVDKTYRKTKRVMVVTAHFGNWELGMSYLLEKGFSLAGVYAPYREDEVVQWILNHRNSEVEWIPAARGAAEACISALERGRILGMVADIPFGEKGHRVAMAGSSAHLPLGPWAIAARARATVIPGFVLRLAPGQYKIIFHEPIAPREGSFRKQMVESQEIFRGHLESYLRQYPEQWGVLQPFWDQKASC